MWAALVTCVEFFIAMVLCCSTVTTIWLTDWGNVSFHYANFLFFCRHFSAFLRNDMLPFLYFCPFHNWAFDDKNLSSSIFNNYFRLRKRVISLCKFPFFFADIFLLFWEMICYHFCTFVLSTIEPLMMKFEFFNFQQLLLLIKITIFSVCTKDCVG